MPTKPLIPCRATGCQSLVSSGYCDAHRNLQWQASQDYDHGKRRYSAELAAAAEIRNTSQWQKVRKLHCAMYPLCCDPFGDHKQMPALNQQRHHILPLVTHPHLAFTMSNIAPLCTRCHSRIEQMERAGQPTCQLFVSYQQSAAPISFIG